MFAGNMISNSFDLNIFLTAGTMHVRRNHGYSREAHREMWGAEKTDESGKQEANI